MAPPNSPHFCGASSPRCGDRRRGQLVILHCHFLLEPAVILHNHKREWSETQCIARGAWPRRLSPPRALTVWNGGTKQVGGPLDPNGGPAVHRVLNEEWVANLSAAGVKLATMDTYVDRNDNLTAFEGVTVVRHCHLLPFV